MSPLARASCMMLVAVVLLAFPARNMAEVSSANQLIGMRSDQKTGWPTQQQQQAKRDYGPLGNLIAYLATLGRTTTTANGASRGKAKSDTCAVPAKASRGSSTPGQALKGVRELLKMLWSNFLPDPTFDRAIAALMHRDQQLGMDAEAGEGGFITAVQKEVLLSRTYAEVSAVDFSRTHAVEV